MSEEFDANRDRLNSPRRMPDGTSSRTTPEALELALNAAQPKRGKDTGEWVNTLTEIESSAGPARSQPQASTAEAAEDVGLGMAQMMDRLFDSLTHYAAEYHRSVYARTDAINVERPVQVKAGDERYGSRGPASFTGRLALREWSLVVRGQPEKIDGVIIPSDQLFNYRANPDGFAPYFVLELRSSGEYGRWMIGRKPVTVHQLPLFSKQLLSALVRIAKKGKVTSVFRFTTGKTVAMDAVAPPAASQDQTLPQRPRSFDEDSDPVFFALTSGSLPVISEPSPQDVTPGSEPGVATAAHSSFDRQSQGSTQNMRVSEALRVANDGLAAELGAIQEAVSYALANDPSAAEQLVTRSARIKDLQDRIRELREDWLNIKPSG